MMKEKANYMKNQEVVFWNSKCQQSRYHCNFLQRFETENKQNMSVPNRFAEEPSKCQKVKNQIKTKH